VKRNGLVIEVLVDDCKPKALLNRKNSLCPLALVASGISSSEPLELILSSKCKNGGIVLLGE
jgi:hypothetical protein